MAKQVVQANSRRPVRTTKVEGACFGSKRSPVRVWAPRPAGQLVVRFEFAWCICFGVVRAQPGPRWGKANAALGHDLRSKCSITTAPAGQRSLRSLGAVLRGAVAVREGPGTPPETAPAARPS